MIAATALILAGGASRRMGRAKATLPIGGATILERSVATLSAEFDDLIVTAAPTAVEKYSVETLLGDRASLRLIRDDEPFAGPAPALARGLRAARHPIVFACSCDLPFLCGASARALCNRIGAFDALVPRVTNQLQPLCAVYRRETAATIERLVASGARRLIEIVARLNLRVLDESDLRAIEPDLRSFLNVNTPEDYARALQLLDSGSA